MLYKALASPKRSGARRDHDLYYYYAAFAQSFVDEKICELGLPGGALILDPWCGSGTTLVSARRFGHPSFGCDINPVSVVLTKSRFASAEDADAVVSQLDEAISSVARAARSKRGPEKLLWALRDKLLGAAREHHYRSMQPRKALLLTTLFFFARQALRKARSKNPSWRINDAVPHLTLSQLRDSFENLRVALESFKGDAIPGAYEFDVAVLDNEREALSIYLFVEACRLPSNEYRQFSSFIFLLWRRLKEESKAGMDRKNRELYSFQSLLSSAPGEEYQIKRRHDKMVELYDYYRSRQRIKGD